MAGINQLSDIFKKKGKEFVDKLFNQIVTVSEKLDGSIFAFEKNLTDEGISFYKRDQDNPISKIDRILMSYYERPINYIESLSPEIRSQIPNGWRFGMEYFCDNKPVNLAYQREPKNGLVLTHVIVKNEIGEPVRTIVEKKELDYWADLLEVERSPIIFQGMLNEDQKIKILEYLSTPYIDILKKYKTDSFVRFMISILNPEMEKTALNDSLDSPIEGVVFRFGELDGVGESYVAKIVDPVFLEIVREKKSTSKDKLPNDIYSLALIDVMNFILEKEVDSFNASGEEPETRYVNFVFDVFLKFVDLYGDRYRGVDFNEPEYFKRDEFKINKELIPNEQVKEKIDEDESYETLLQILLSAFRKLKKKPHGFFTEGVVEQFNLLIRDIADYINAKKQEPIQESSGIPTFGQFRKIHREFSLLNESEEETQEEEIPEKIDDNETAGTAEKTNEFFAYNDFKKVIKTHKEKRKDRKINENAEKVNLIIGKFQPFNNGHLKMAMRAKKENGYPSVICVYRPSKTNKKYPFSHDTLEKMMSGVKEEYPDLIKEYYFIGRDFLDEAFEGLSENYYPVSICVGEKNYSNLHLQRDWTRSNGALINEEIKLFKTPTWLSGKDVRNLIKHENFAQFKKSVPKSVSLLYNQFLSEMSGSEDI